MYFYPIRKMVAILITTTLVGMVYLGSWPLEASGSHSRSGENPSTLTLSPVAGQDQPGFVEKTDSSRTALKKKGFPWLWVLGGVVVAGAALFFLLNKKEGSLLHEDFDGTLGGQWITYQAQNWSVANGLLSVTAPVSWEFQSAIYNQVWSTKNYTVSVRMKRSISHGAYGIFLSRDTNLAAGYGYTFDIWDDTFAVLRNNGYQFGPRTDSYNHSWTNVIKDWGQHSGINAGLDVWNVFKVVRDADSYAFYANGTLLHSFTDSTYDPRYVSIIINPSAPSSRLDVDYVYIDQGGTASSLGRVPFSLVSPEAMHTDLVRRK